ncbi:hypothetical protein JCM9279_004366 [Rhodotorula babjevae]
MGAHHRLRSSSATSSDSDRGSSAASHSAGNSDDDDDRHKSRHDASSSGSDSDDEPERQSSNLVPIVLVALLLLCAIAAAAYFYLRQGSTGAASASDAASAGGAAGSSGGAGTASAALGTAVSSDNGAGAADSAGSGDAGGGGASKTSSSTASSGSSASKGGSGDGPSASRARSTSSGSPGSSSSSPAAAPSASHSPSSSPSTSTSSNGCKKGVGYNDAKYTTQLDMCWVYDWSSAGGEGVKDGVMYVPMLWGPKQVDGWEENAKKALAAGATHVLGFNEPDLPEQANLSPSAASQLWKDHIEPLAGSAKLVSPAVTNGVKLDNGTSMGVPWLVDFLAACDGCTINALALHWYDSAGNTAYFTSYLEDSHKTLNKPIWLTEYMGTGTPAEQKTFLEFAVPYLEKQDWIERHAAFGDFLDNPVAEFIAADDGSLNDLGKAYSEAK